MFINLYIARPTYRFILIYACGLTAVIKRICYVMLCQFKRKGMWYAHFTEIYEKCDNMRQSHICIKLTRLSSKRQRTKLCRLWMASIKVAPWLRCSTDQKLCYIYKTIKTNTKHTTATARLCWDSDMPTFPQHTHTRLTALCPGLPRWAGTRKVKPTWILLKQERVSGSGRWFLEFTWIWPNGISISSSILVELPNVTNRQAHRPQNVWHVQSINQSINVKFIGRCYTTRPGAPTVVSGISTIIKYTRVLFWMYQCQ